MPVARVFDRKLVQLEFLPHFLEFGGQFEAQRSATVRIELLAGVSLAGIFLVLMVLYIVAGLNRRRDDVTDEKFADSCYYLGFILLLGAEVNSWAQGQRQTEADIPSILHEVQAHNTTRGAAGPTAGEPQEDVQHHEGAAAMDAPEKAVRHEREEHDTDAQPPKFAEAGNPGPDTLRPQSSHEERTTRQAEQQTAGTAKGGEQNSIGERSRAQSVPATSVGTHGTHGAHLTSSERTARKRKTFGTLAVTTGATLVSLLLLHRRTTATT